MIVRLATHADRLPKSSQRRSCLLAEPKDTAKSLDEAISVQPLVNSRGAGLAYDFFRFLRRPPIKRPRSRFFGLERPEPLPRSQKPRLRPLRTTSACYSPRPRHPLPFLKAGFLGLREPQAVPRDDDVLAPESSGLRGEAVA